MATQQKAEPAPAPKPRKTTRVAKKPIEVKRPMTDERMSAFIRLTVLTWSGGLLTLYYLGGLQRLDTTFIGGLLTQTLAAFGITLGSQQKKEEKERRAPELDGQETKRAPRID